MEIAELYVLVTKDFAGNVTGYPQGGGSSTAPRIKAFDNIESARRSKRRHDGFIMRVTAMEAVE